MVLRSVKVHTLPSKSAPPRDYLALRQRIGACYPELTPHLQAIARFALGHPDAMAVERVTQLATMIGVQPSSIVRFAKLLGFDGVKDLRPLFKELHGDLITATQCQCSLPPMKKMGTFSGV
ncbi:MAG: hypothetical protein AAF637_21625 [Pseudomonadota bacterium]